MNVSVVCGVYVLFVLMNRLMFGLSVLCVVCMCDGLCVLFMLILILYVCMCLVC